MTSYYTSQPISGEGVAPLLHRLQQALHTVLTIDPTGRLAFNELQQALFRGNPSSYAQSTPTSPFVYTSVETPTKLGWVYNLAFEELQEAGMLQRASPKDRTAETGVEMQWEQAPPAKDKPPPGYVAAEDASEHNIHNAEDSGSLPSSVLDLEIAKTSTAKISPSASSTTIIRPISPARPSSSSTPAVPVHSQHITPRAIHNPITETERWQGINLLVAAVTQIDGVINKKKK